MNNKITLGIFLATTLATAAIAAKVLPPMQYIPNAQPGVEQKLNVAYYHIEELERVVQGLQEENNKRHAYQADLEKRMSGFATRDQHQEASIKELNWTITRGLEAADHQIDELKKAK